MKDAARLSADLLARKGEAAPAMSPQLPTGSKFLSGGRWVPLGFGSRKAEGEATPPADTPAEARSGAEPLPVTAAIPEPDNAPLRPEFSPPGEGRIAASGRRIALTLRLDRRRHLGLKIVSAHVRRSGQNLMLEALDSLLDSYAEVVREGEAILANGIERSASRRGAGPRRRTRNQAKFGDIST